MSQTKNLDLIFQQIYIYRYLELIFNIYDNRSYL